MEEVSLHYIFKMTVFGVTCQRARVHLMVLFTLSTLPMSSKEGLQARYMALNGSRLISSISVWEQAMVGLFYFHGLLNADFRTSCTVYGALLESYSSSTIATPWALSSYD